MWTQHAALYDLHTIRCSIIINDWCICTICSASLLKACKGLSSLLFYGGGIASLTRAGLLLQSICLQL